MKKFIPYLICLVLFTVFCCGIYGPVFLHLSQENYFAFDSGAMAFVLREPLGTLYWISRFLMLPLQNQWIGGIYLAILLTLLTWFTDRTLRVSSKWYGIGALLPACILIWAVSRGYNLFMRSEPSKVVFYIYVFLLLTGILALVISLFFKKKISAEKSFKWPVGLLCPILILVLLNVGAWIYRQNLILSCDMQNKLLIADWDGMIEDALKAKNPDKSIAAFHAIALNQKGQLLEKMFEIDYDFPPTKLDDKDGLDESENFTAECNLFSCLPQPAYHYALCQQVVEGPRLRFLKMMIICSALQQEDALCSRYLAFLDKMPFQHEFVETWERRLENPQLTAEDPTMARILQQVSFEDGFENDYARPCYIGFNLGVRRATPETLKASMAAALYCKDLENVIFRAAYLKQIEALPTYVQEALVVASAKRQEILQQFPEISDMMKIRVSSFANEASPYLEQEDTSEVYEALYEKWGNSFLYYYYFGNRNRAVQDGFVTAVN